MRKIPLLLLCLIGLFSAQIALATCCTVGAHQWTIGGSGTTLATTSTTTQATGSTFVVTFVTKGGTTPASVTDNKSNTYTFGQTISYGGGGVQIWMYYCINCAGGTGYIATATWTTSGVASGIALDEFLGVGAGSIDLTPTATQNATGTGPIAAPTITTTVANELVVAAFASFGGNAQTIGDTGSGFTIIDSQATGSGLNGAVSWANPASSSTAANETFTYTAFDYTGSVAMSIKPASASTLHPAGVFVTLP